MGIVRPKESDNEGTSENPITTTTTKKVEFSQSIPSNRAEDTRLVEKQPSVTSMGMMSGNMSPLITGTRAVATSVSTTSPLVSTNQNRERYNLDSNDRQSSRGGTSSGSSTPIRRRSSPAGSIMIELRKMSLASQDAKEERKLNRFRRFHGRRRKRKEEEYTDKDRAAAVTLGSRDIKQSLRAKKKRERKLCISTDLPNQEDFLSDMLLNEATHQMRIKDIAMALNTLDKALELQPNHRAALVARSQCYLKLGDAYSALKDAKACYDPTNPFIHGLYQYAEALYNMGFFEKALISYHKGYRKRQEKNTFRIGVQKCQEAIEKCIGDRASTRIDDLDKFLPRFYANRGCKSHKLSDDASGNVSGNPLVKVQHFQSRELNRVSRGILGQMYSDKEYLINIVKRSQSNDGNNSGAISELQENALEALEYLQVREEFWRQQNPRLARKPGLNSIGSTNKNLEERKINSRLQNWIASQKINFQK